LLIVSLVVLLSLLCCCLQRMNELTLAGCLRRFARPERLGPAAHWRCSSCGSTAAALKQMSIRRLPLVLCFHVKRFEHGGATQRPRKLDVPLRFPLQGLDMAPFTTSHVLRSQLLQHGACSNAAFAAPGAAAEAGVEGGVGGSYQQQCLYELFGVVSHWGDMQSGHYVSYVKCDGFWYLINDPWVVAVTEADVAQVQAYMLFYAQQHVFGSVSSTNSTAGSSQVKASLDNASLTGAAAAALVAQAAAGSIKSEVADAAAAAAAAAAACHAPDIKLESAAADLAEPGGPVAAIKAEQ